MNPSPLSALSPLDGRYAAKVAPLRPLLSEFGLMHRRVQVEVEWFIALSDAGSGRVQAARQGRARPAAPPCRRLRRSRRPGHQGHRDAPPTTTSRRWSTGSRPAFAGDAELSAAAEFVHFACTSEDINNTSHALMLKSARAEVLLPALDTLIDKLRAMAHALADVPMLSRTHGQTASPTTLGKEVANVVARLWPRRAHASPPCRCWPR